MIMAIPKIFLRRGKEESLQRRHPWIFSGAIYSVECDRELVEGEIVDLYSSQGQFLARGHYQSDAAFGAHCMHSRF